LGQPNHLLGFDFIENGQLLKNSLDEAGISYTLLPVPGAIRTNVKIFEEERQEMTELNQEGAEVSPQNVASLQDLVATAKADVLVLSGSLPQGVDTGIYADIIRRSKAKIILDAYGPALLQGLEAGPQIIKPNIAELESSFKVSLPDKKSQLEFCQELIRRYNLQAVCLSLGADGAMLVCENEAYFAPALDIQVRGVQGAGDSMVAGLAMGLLNGAIPQDMLKTAVAVAAASLIREGTLMATKQDYEKMLAMVNVKML